MTLGPVNLSPLVSGYVADKYGWRMNFWILTAFTAAALILIIFAAPETTYNRPIVYETDLTSIARQNRSMEETTSETTEHGDKHSSSALDREVPMMDYGTNQLPRSYWQELRPFRGIETRDNPFVLLARLFVCACYPAVFWSFLVGGTYVAWVSTSKKGQAPGHICL